MQACPRCKWVDPRSALYTAYHDNEWGVPVRDEARMVEMFLLETFQAGLSWITILKKREAFRAAFDGFDAEKIAAYGEEKIAALLQDAGVIRCRRKIEGAIANARAVLDIRREFGSFCAYVWRFTNGETIVNRNECIQTTSPLSDAMTADMKARGMRYVGSVTIYSFLQAVGVVNDHETNCFRHPDFAKKQAEKRA